MHPLLDLENLHFRFQAGDDFVQSIFGTERVQQFLLLIGLKHHVRSNGIGETVGLGYIGNGGDRFQRNFLVEFGVLFELTFDAAHQRFKLGGHLGVFFNAGDFYLIVIGVFLKSYNPPSLHPFHQHLHSAIGELQDLQNIRKGSGLINIAGLGVIRIGMTLRRKKNTFLFCHGFFQRADGLLPTDKQGNHHERKYNDIPQGNEGQYQALCTHNQLACCWLA